jgi:hypothetical protein
MYQRQHPTIIVVTTNQLIAYAAELFIDKDMFGEPIPFLFALHDNRLLRKDRIAAVYTDDPEVARTLYIHNFPLRPLLQ